MVRRTNEGVSLANSWREDVVLGRFETRTGDGSACCRYCAFCTDMTVKRCVCSTYGDESGRVHWPQLCLCESAVAREGYLRE